MAIVQQHENKAPVDAGALAHELANTVQALSGNLELIAGSNSNEQVQRYLANARAAARQLEETIRKLRDG